MVNMIFQPLIDVIDIATGNGWMELPESYGGRVFALAKGAGHRYIRRVPKAGGGYRYYYHVGHGGGVANTDHFVEGAAFQHDGGHFHVKAVDGDKLTIEHDETGEKKTVTKAQLRGMLTERHGKELDAHRAKVHADLADAKKAGASPKQLARLEERAKAAGPAPKPEPKTKPASGPDADAIEHMRHRRNEAAKPRSMNEWAKTAAAEEKGHAWTRHIPAGVKSEKGKFRVSNSTGGREVEGNVSGVWGLSGDTVTHIPTGLSVYVGDGAKHAFAVFATHAPKWGADGKFDDGNSVRAKMGEIREGANTLKELLTDRAVRHINDATSRASKIETAESRAASVQTSGPSGEFRVKAKPADFEKAHKRASIFASQDASRQSITSVHSDGAGNLVATDGRRIAIIPTSHSESGNYSASGRKTNDTNYPDYERLIGTIPKGHKAAEFNADSLRSSIQAHTAQLTKEGKSIRVVQFGPSGITSNADSPSTHAVQHRGEVTEFGIDPKMLSNALAGAKGTVRLHSGGRFDPIHIEREDGERHLIMPMRI